MKPLPAFAAILLACVLIAVGASNIEKRSRLSTSHLLNSSVRTSAIMHPVETDRLPDATSCSSGLCTIRDIMAWDLRDTVPVREVERKMRKISPARFINYLHVVRRRQDQHQYVAHFATSGFGIDFNVVTHNATVYHRRDVDPHHPPEYEQYAVEVNVEHEPVGSEFLVIVEGIYWNGFWRPTESAETYADDDLPLAGELAVLVVFPQSRPPHNVSRWMYSSGNNTPLPFVGTEIFSEGQGRYLYWSIRSHQAGEHYELRWDW